MDRAEEKATKKPDFTNFLNTIPIIWINRSLLPCLNVITLYLRIQRGGVRSQKLVDVCDQIEVREHYPLGKAGGATGVGKSGERLLRRLIGLSDGSLYKL